MKKRIVNRVVSGLLLTAFVSASISGCGNAGVANKEKQEALDAGSSLSSEESDKETVLEEVSLDSMEIS